MPGLYVRSRAASAISIVRLRGFAHDGATFAVWLRELGGSMADDRRSEDQEQISDDEVVGKAADEDMEFEDTDELDETDQEESDMDEA